MKNNDLDKEILDLYNKLDKQLSDEQKNKIHFKSVSNFVYHLILNPKLNPKKNKKLQELGEKRIKKELLQYLKLDFDFDMTIKESIDFFQIYLGKTCDFMTNYYNFSSSGGKSKFITIISVLLLGFILDFLMYFFAGFSIPTFVFSFLIIFIIRTYLKHKQRRVYGPNY